MVVFCHTDGSALWDPNPTATAGRDVVLLTEPPADGPFAAVGWGPPGLRAAALAASHPGRVSRVVLCCLPIPEGDLEFDPSAITAKVLLLHGHRDPRAPASAAQWWKARLGQGRIEMVPRRGDDFLPELWDRVLSHAAPGSKR